MVGWLYVRGYDKTRHRLHRIRILIDASMACPAVTHTYAMLKNSRAADTEPSETFSNIVKVVMFGLLTDIQCIILCLWYVFLMRWC